MSRNVMAERLVEIADELDALGLIEEANEVDSIVQSMVNGGMQRSARAGYQVDRNRLGAGAGWGQTRDQFLETPAALGMNPAATKESLRRQMEITQRMDPYKSKYRTQPAAGSRNVGGRTPGLNPMEVMNDVDRQNNYDRMLREYMDKRYQRAGQGGQAAQSPLGGRDYVGEYQQRENRDAAGLLENRRLQEGLMRQMMALPEGDPQKEILRNQIIGHRDRAKGLKANYGWEEGYAGAGRPQVSDY